MNLGNKMKYILFDSIGKILGNGTCQSHMLKAQAHKPNQFVVENIWGFIDYAKMKIGFDGFDIESKQPVNPRIIDKTSAEIEASKLPEPKLLPFEKQQAYITNEQLQTILDRLAVLEEEKLPLEL